MAEERKTLNFIGRIAFLIAFVIAIIMGLLTGAEVVTMDTFGWIILTLVILGLIVGLLNITQEEVANFLIASVALIVFNTLSGLLLLIPYIGNYIVAIINFIAIFVAPAALIVALKAVVSMTKN
ncbi:MAG TPA: hypothetical protein HA341_00770 [Halobacteria archaeon]|jgi:hypothetical protein|nr:hypothetical protein [Halobacteria archaeon]